MAHGHFSYAINTQLFPKVCVVQGYIRNLLLVHLTDKAIVGVAHVSGQQVHFVVGLLHFGQVHGSRFNYLLILVFLATVFSLRRLQS